MKKCKYLILFLIAFFSFDFYVRADVVTYPRLEDNHHGVKKWDVRDDNMSNVMSTPLVDPSEKIYDFANLLSTDEKNDLRDYILKFYQKYNTEIIILTVNESYYYDSKNETIASDFYDYNDFGIDFPRYDGILIYRNAYSQDPYYDIYTFGDAQLYFNQSRYDEVLDDVYPYISMGKYPQGFTMFIDYFFKYYNQGVAKKNYYVDDMGYLQKKYVPPYLMATIISGIITFIIIIILINKNKMVVKATNADIYLDMSSVKYRRRDNIFVNSRTTSYTISSSSGGHSGGGSHSGSSGGGHSSGGGRHG